ncbi:MAG TPA: heme ABC exporter ATP-binding protein CcmA [Gemmatimonadaceae bacterium]|nr:heme ABC exporter ATP-binding protein CcmA [Gemmatimonadaceae bacterium]
MLRHLIRISLQQAVNNHNPRPSPRSATPAAAQQTDRSALVALSGLSRRFARRWALRNARLRVHAGEIVGITGHNGSGKSTLLRVLCTALRPSAGQGTVCGYDLVRDADQVRARTAFLAHTPGLYDDLTAEENLRFAATMLGLASRGIAAALERVGLAGEADTRVRGFSAGMQRRLGIARVLLHAPPVVLLDEPYNSLDTEGIELVNDVMRETRARGGAVLVVIHDLVRVAPLVDRVVEMRAGAMLEPVAAVASPLEALAASSVPQPVR